MDYRFLTAGERCVTVCFGDEICIEINRYVSALRNELRSFPVPGVSETVPTYCALSVHYDPCVIRRKELEHKLTEAIEHMTVTDCEMYGVKEVPVCYGGELGPDLEYCAQLEGVDVREIIRRHSSHEYYVYQLGFSPGHPYMAREEEPFSFRRRESPRVDIPEHSVVVQSNLTNITPFHQACGWNIIGSTPVNITDYDRQEPFFFKAGDRVRFIPVDREEYDRIKSGWAGTKDGCALPAEMEQNLQTGGRGFTVLAPGLLTTIQDEGRFGYQSGGVTPAGPMDVRAYRLANILVGNRRNEAALEATMQGPELRFDRDSFIAITGADMSPRLNGCPAEMYRTVRVRAGDVLSFGRRISGCRSYIAFAGGINENRMMGSCSTDIKNHLGGHHGRALKSGDVISAGECGNRAINCLPKETYNDREIVVRVVLGPQDNRFTRKGIRSFLNHSSTVTDKLDRQGIRLEHEPIEFVTDGNIISDGICMGAVQVANDGKPTILLADRQSVGGYAKIASVIYADLPKLAQAVQGCRIRFAEVSVELAEELYIREMQFIKKLEDRYVQG